MLSIALTSLRLCNCMITRPPVSHFVVAYVSFRKAAGGSETRSSAYSQRGQRRTLKLLPNIALNEDTSHAASKYT